MLKNTHIKKENMDFPSRLRLRTFLAGCAAIGVAVPAMAASTAYQGSLSCEASLTTPSDLAFVAPVAVKVDGTTVTWTREAPGMREVVTGSLQGDRVALDGFGGSVSANTHQAFYDWKITGDLAFAGDGLSGKVQLLNKDGRTLQRHCTFATKGAAGVSTVAAAAVQTAPPAPSLANVPNTSKPETGTMDQAAELQRREDALAARERALAQREQEVASAAKPASVQSPVAPQAPAAPSAPALASSGTAAASVNSAGTAVVLGAVADQLMRSPAALRAGISGSTRETTQNALTMASGPMHGAPTPWPTKAAFLTAVREGKFVDAATLSDGLQDSKLMLDVVSNILGSEYQVPQFPRDPMCTGQFSGNVTQLFRETTARELSALSSQPPTFRQATQATGYGPDDLKRRILESRACDLEVMGIRKEHPYKKALVQLSDEYAQATREYVQAEADRRAQAFAQQQAQQQAAAAATVRRQQVQAEQERRASRPSGSPPAAAAAVSPSAPSQSQPTRKAAVAPQGDI